VRDSDDILHLEFLWQTPLPLLLLGVKLEEQHASLALALFILTGRKLGGDYHRFVWLKVVQLWGPAGGGCIAGGNTRINCRTVFLPKARVAELWAPATQEEPSQHKHIPPISGQFFDVHQSLNI